MVDDNSDIRDFVRIVLLEEGYEVAEAVDGKTSLKAFQDLEPSIVILDVSMGKPDGLEVCRDIRKTSNVPIIMLTNRGDESDEAIGSSFEFSSDKLLDTHASRTRMKVKEASGPKVLIAIRGAGYRLMLFDDLSS